MAILAGPHGTLPSCRVVVRRHPYICPFNVIRYFYDLTWDGAVLTVEPQVLMEIRRLVVESEAAHPTARGSGGGITFSGGNGAANPTLLKPPTMLDRSAG